MNNQIGKLPSKIDYPKILMLLLRNNDDLTEIPVSFFAAQGELNVLDLGNKRLWF